MPVDVSYDEEWTVLELEKEILEVFSSDTTMVYSCTWMPLNKLDVALEWVNKSSNHKAVFVGLMDPSTIDFPKHPRIFNITTEDIIFWLLATGRYFKDYYIEDTQPASFESYFLCYQRKSSPPRELLYNALKHKNGVVTLSGKKCHHINRNITPYKELHDYRSPDPALMPHDIFSLGNMDIWNSSFLNIVSETVQGMDPIFISEKTFKPIIGMRPFIHYGPTKINTMLEDRGFKMFNDDFNYHPPDHYNNQINPIISVVDNIKHPRSQYINLYQKVVHNYNHFPIAAEQEWQKVRELAASIHSA